MSDETNGWPEHRRLVLHELQEMRAEIAALRNSQANIREDIAGLKALAGFIGGLAGAASSLIGRLF